MSDVTLKANFRVILHLSAFDPERKGGLVESLLAHRKDQGRLWVKEVLTAVSEGESPLIYQTNAIDDAWNFAQDLSNNGGEVNVFYLSPEGQATPLFLDL